MMTTIAAEDLVEGFREGYLRGITWNSETLACAKHAVDTLSAASLPSEVTMIDNDFTTAGSFRTLLDLIASQPTLERLSIAHGDLSLLLADLVDVLAAPRSNNGCVVQLQDLELIATRSGKIKSAAAPRLRALVQGTPTLRTLTLGFTLAQRDYGPVLQALRQGLDEYPKSGGSVTTAAPPRVIFRNVCFPDHEYHLHRFVAMLCEARSVVDTLELYPRRSNNAIMIAASVLHAGNAFLEAMARLLAFGNVRHLEIPQIIIVPDRNKSVLDDGVLANLRLALARNTSLERFSLPCTKGMDVVWQQALFPALTLNRTLSDLGFANDGDTLTTFLQYLPRMSGLKRVRAPWRVSDSHTWCAALQKVETLCHVCFIPQCLSNTKEDFDNCNLHSPAIQSVQALLQRNRYLAEAREMLITTPERVPQPDKNGLYKPYPATENVLAAKLQEFGAADEAVGLSASYVLLRESSLLPLICS